MKLAVIKLGARIVNKGTSGGSGEAISIIKLLSLAGNDVHYFTKILDTDPKIDFATPHNIFEDDVKNYDALIIINGIVNFFGGVEDPLQLTNYKIINNFKGPIFYMYCDPNLFLRQIWKSVENKKWGKKYSKDDIYISRDDIVYIHQPYNIEPFRSKIERQINVKKYVHFPFYKFPLMNKRLEYNNKIKDLGYGGTLRYGKRENKLLKFYFGYDKIKSYLFGNIKLKKFKKWDGKLNPPIIEHAVQYNEFLNKQSEFYATVNIGDKEYEGNTLSQRIYESILANNICFIDKEFDPEMRIFQNDKLKDLLYVNNREEVKERLLKLKDEKIHKKICDLQYNDVKININKYASELSNIIKENL